MQLGIFALVLARPAWVVGAAPATMLPNAVVGELLHRYPPPEARERFEASDLAHRLEAEAPDNLASLRGFFTREPVAVTSELLTRIAADGPGVDGRAVEALRVPTLVIGHGRDLVHPLAQARTLTAMIPGARMVEIAPKAGGLDRYRSEFRAALSTFLLAL
jgi:pimeloyl-ACP methyl ester carboxylesterase